MSMTLLWEAEKKGNLYLAAYILWGLFAFLSNSLLATFHLFVGVTFLFCLFKRHSLVVTKSEVSLSLFILFAMVSVFVNWNELIGPFSKLIKIKYLVVGLLASLLARVYSFQLRQCIKIPSVFFLLSFSLTVAYGLYRVIADYLFLEAIYRPTGFFGMIMSYSYTAIWPVLLMLFLVLNSQIKFEFKSFSFLDKNHWRWLFFILFFITLCLTQARGALVGFFLALPFLLISRKKLLLATLALLFSFSIFAYQKVKASSHEANPENRVFQGAKSQSNLERLSQFDMAYHAFLEKPFLGQGWRSLEERSLNIKEKYSLDQKTFAGHAHNNYLEVLGTTGGLGLLFFILWIFFWLKESYWKNNSEWRYFYLAGIVGFLVSGLFQSTLIDSEYAFTLFAFYGMTPLFVETSPS